MNVKNSFFFTLLLMISFPVVNAVLITPALPAISIFFHITPNITQQIVIWYLIGYALGQLLYGPLANRFGRKKALYFGIGLQIISSLLCALAGLIYMFPLLIIARFMMALGSGVGLKMAFTLVNEYYSPAIVSQKISYLMLSFAIAPGVSIAIGGILTQEYNWIMCFYASAIYGVFLLFLSYQLAETKMTLDFNALKFKHLLRIYIDQFKNIQLFGGGLLMGITVCFIYVFSTIAPFIAINLMGMDSKEYGAASIIPSIGYVILVIIIAKSSTKYKPLTFIKAGILITSCGTLLMFLAVFMHLPALASLFIPITLIYFGEVLIYPNTSALAMSTVSDTAHASAVMGFLTISVSTISVLSMGLFSITTYLLPITFTILCISMFLIYKWIALQQKPN